MRVESHGDSRKVPPFISSASCFMDCLPPPQPPLSPSPPTPGPCRLLEQHAWAVAQAGANHTAFWRTTALLLEQLGGLVEGYAAAQRERSDLPPLGLSDFLFIGAVGELQRAVCVMVDSWEQLGPGWAGGWAARGCAG